MLVPRMCRPAHPCRSLIPVELMENVLPPDTGAGQFVRRGVTYARKLLH